MPNYKRERLTIGVLAGWQVYEGTNPNLRLEATFKGIAAEARGRGFNLLLACGVGARVEPQGVHPAWPVLSTATDFVPVGPWNVDGLVVIAPVQDEERTAYIQGLIRDGFPVVFVGSGEGRPAVVPDNATGIHQALAHLSEHGHRQVAFIAGDPLDSGESMERLMVFQSALAQHNLTFDWHCMAYGLNHQAGGYKAMETILKNGATFTAVMASNDASAVGALQALQAAGRRVPQDVAVIGFEDHPEAAVHVPPLTSVAYPFETAGRRAVGLLASRIDGRELADEIIRIPTELMKRQSCGCLPGSDLVLKSAAPLASIGSAKADKDEAFVDELTAALAGQALPLEPAELRALSHRLLDGFRASLTQNNPADFQAALLEVLQRVEALDASAHAWQAVVSGLRRQWAQWAPPGGDRAEVTRRAEDLLHLARAVISESARRQDSRHQFFNDDYNDRLSILTVQLLAAANTDQVFNRFFEHLPRVGLRDVQVALFEKDEADPVAWSRLGMGGGEGAPRAETRFRTRDFPPPEICPAGQPFSLALVPLIYQTEALGFMAFDSANLRPCATLARQMAVALKSAWLNAEVRELSLTDSLTGLHNRRYLDLFMPEEVERSRRNKYSLSVIMLDLDHFKSYNDTYGHPAGDQALQVVAQCLRQAARRSVDAIMRYGGEEFILVLPETGADGVYTVAENIRKLVATSTGFKRTTTVSLGVTTMRGTECDTDSLIHQADTALYQAKKSGRNRVCASVIRG
jgi:diguanylate cyclase (GGDEF)-like protein